MGSSPSPIETTSFKPLGTDRITLCCIAYSLACAFQRCPAARINALFDFANPSVSATRNGLQSFSPGLAAEAYPGDNEPK
jgi:hypothetical protein